MVKEKQIEEMADILCEAKEHDCKGGNDCLCVKQAEALYNAGYRKQSEGYWTLKRPNCSYYCSCCGKGIKIKYGERAAILWEYCPNCGAKMKGGAE